MLLAEPQETAADWHFDLAGIRVRVSAWFWLAAALLGWNICQAFARGDQRALLQFLVIWIGVVFLSLLVHELGHAFAYRAFGQGAHVVLYHFGGIAIPELWGRRGHLRPFQRLLVSAAGPIAQLALAAAIVAALKLTGYSVPFPIEALGRSLGLDGGRLGHSRRRVRSSPSVQSACVVKPICMGPGSCEVSSRNENST